MHPAFMLPRFSFGVGDRFASQALPQLRACQRAAEAGVEIAPVWNKSQREHALIGTDPAQTRAAADAAVRALGWNRPYFLDADHINLSTVERFLAPCDFFTIDVTDAIGQPADPAAVQALADRHPELLRELSLPGLAQPLSMDRERMLAIAAKYLAATRQAGEIYRYIESRKGRGQFVTEVSMDETDQPQTPAELLLILAALADAGVPLATLAPKFSGRFNKGVDYEGDREQFRREFLADLAVIAYAIEHYGLPQALKLSVHSGSDKFSLYPILNAILRETGAGLHLKTAGTTWLEELIGLAESGGEGLRLAQEIYAETYARREELCAPYAAVIAIDPARLPSPGVVARWTSAQFTAALRHDPRAAAYNPSLRQLLHVGYKIAAQLGDRYRRQLKANAGIIARNVETNLYDRHLRPIFLAA